MQSIFIRIATMMLVLGAGFPIAWGQTSADTISMKRTLSGLQFQMGTQWFYLPGAVSAMKPNPEAYQLMRTARTHYMLGNAIGIPGAFLLGWSLGGALGGGELNTNLLTIGGMLLVVSLPFSQSFSRKSGEAMRIYNRGVRGSASVWEQSHIRWYSTGTGLGMRVTF